jgi:hypothetical protein
MLKPCRVFLILALLMPLSLGAWGLEFALDKEETEALDKKSADSYQAGVKQLDHINYDGALAHFVKAQKSAPDHQGLCFLVGKLAMYEARKEMGDEAVRKLRLAETAYANLVEMKGVRRAERARAASRLKRVQGLIDTQAERDARRKKIGRMIVADQARALKEIHAKKAAAVRAKAAERAEKLKKEGKSGAGSGLSGMMGGGMSGGR